MSGFVFKTETVHRAIWNNNFEQAKKLIQYKAKKNPELQAYRLGLVIRELVDPDGIYRDPDDAAELLEEFNTTETKRKTT